VRDRRRARVSRVGEVVEQDRDLLGGVIADQAGLEVEGIDEAAPDVVDEIGLERIAVEEPEVLRLDLAELRPGGERGEEGHEADENTDCAGRSHRAVRPP
jgi:hypothetical protein